MFNWLDKLVSENDIAFLKWDYNRNWSEPRWNTAPGGSVDGPNTDVDKEIYVRYVQNLYDVLGRLRKKHPKLEIESCSGGGGRVDLGILQFTDEVWPSDNTDALDRLSMQNGYTHAYSPQTMAAWVTDVPNLDGRDTPLQFRFLVAMQGALGIGNNLNKWTNEDFALGAKLTALYKTIRTTVQQGSLYRLTQPTGGDQNNEEGASQVEYVARDDSQAVLLGLLALYALPGGLSYGAVTRPGSGCNVSRQRARCGEVHRRADRLRLSTDGCRHTASAQRRLRQHGPRAGADRQVGMHIRHKTRSRRWRASCSLERRKIWSLSSHTLRSPLSLSSAIWK
jgi:Melibiase